MMKILLSANADVNARDYFRSTALHWSAQRDNAEGVRILCEAKIDPNLRQGQRDLKCDLLVLVYIITCTVYIHTHTHGREAYITLHYKKVGLQILQQPLKQNLFPTTDQPLRMWPRNARRLQPSLHAFKVACGTNSVRAMDTMRRHVPATWKLFGFHMDCCLVVTTINI